MSGHPAEGFIYVIEAGGYHKIGFAATSPRDQLSQMQVGCPLKMTLIGVAEGTRADEDAWHETFKAQRVHGEWFILSDTDIARVLHEPIGLDYIPGEDHIA